VSRPSELRVVLVSSKTGLNAFLNAVEVVSRECNCKLVVRVFYVHELEENRDILGELVDEVGNGDIILLDIRSSTHWFLRELERILSASRARVVIPLVASGPQILRFLRLGENNIGELLASRIKSQGFDSRDMSRITEFVFRLLDSLERLS